MTIENKIRALAGSIILISVVLSLFYTNWWLLLTAFVGANLIQSAFTKFCLAEKLLKKLSKNNNGCCSQNEK